MVNFPECKVSPEPFDSVIRPNSRLYLIRIPGLRDQTAALKALVVIGLVFLANFVVAKQEHFYFLIIVIRELPSLIVRLVISC